MDYDPTQNLIHGHAAQIRRLRTRRSNERDIEAELRKRAAASPLAHDGTARQVHCWSCRRFVATLRRGRYHCKRTKGGCGARWKPQPHADVPADMPRPSGEPAWLRVSLRAGTCVAFIPVEGGQVWSLEHGLQKATDTLEQR